MVREQVFTWRFCVQRTTAEVYVHGKNIETCTLYSRHFGLYKQSKLSVRLAMVDSQLSWAGQYKKCVQYDFTFTSECMYILLTRTCTQLKGRETVSTIIGFLTEL